MKQKFQLIPAIDLKDKQAVRLSQGLMESAKSYSSDPKALAREFEDMGAEWLHLVDLDGAFSGEPINFEVISEIRKNCHLKIELGGGIRDEETIKKYLALGINRIILGSIAYKQPDFAKQMAQKYPIALGIDAKNGKVAIEGWAKEGKSEVMEFIESFKSTPLEAIICTDIQRDGMLKGVNWDFSKEVALKSGHFTIASGGFASIEDLEQLFKSNVGGVIVGKAFYEGKIDLQAAFKKVQARNANV